MNKTRSNRVHLPKKINAVQTFEIKYTVEWLGYFNFKLDHAKCVTCSHSLISLILLIAVTSHILTTKECECHGHAATCHFSQRAWLSSGRLSGGVCEDCQHNTTGRRCHRCRYGYHRRPSLPLSSPHTCTRKSHKAEGCFTVALGWLTCL